MNKDLTDITLVVDRSGSMQQRREDAQGGVNAFVQQQAREPGDALLTLVQFDTEYEIVHSGVPVQDVPEYELVPSDMNEADRPGLVIFVITTDGLENSSQEFTRDQIKEMIEYRQAEHDWHFTFLGANQDAFAEAGGLGIRAASAAQYSMDKVAAAYEGTASKVSRMRDQKRRGEEVLDEFTDEERKKMM
jgi:hypothetical protein